MSAGSVALGVTAILLWSSVLLRRPSWRELVERPSITLTLILFATGVTIDVPPVYVRIDQLMGVPNLANLLARLFGFFGVHVLLCTFVGGRAGGSRLWIRPRLLVPMLVCSVVTTVSFLVTPMPDETTDLTASYGDRPGIALMWLCTIAYLGVATTWLIALVWRDRRASSEPTLRVGLMISAAGAGLLIGYGALKGVQVAGSFLRGRGVPPRFLAALAPLEWMIGSLAVGLFGAGLLVAAQPRVGRDLGARRDLLRLRPLWRELTLERPGLVLGRSPSMLHDLLGRDPSRRLHRRIIEIRDVEFIRAPLLDPVDDDAAGADADWESELQLVLMLARQRRRQSWPTPRLR